MAWDGDRQRVGGASPCHGPHRARRADACGDIGVARGPARGNVAQRLPDPLLEGRAAHVQRQGQAQARCFDEAHHLRHQRLEGRIATDQLGLRKAVLQVVRQHFGVIAQQDGADAAIALRHQDGAERALADRKADRGVDTARTKAACRHAQHLVGLGVEATTRVVAGAVDRLGDRAATGELLAQALCTVRLRIGPWREACCGLEHAVKVMNAQAGALRQLGQGGSRLGGLDEAAQTAHHRGVLRRLRRLVGFAAQAGAKTRALGIGRRCVKGHVLGPRAARRAARAAIHAGGAHRVEKRAVGPRIPRHHRGPARIAHRRRGEPVGLAVRVHGVSVVCSGR